MNIKNDDRKTNQKYQLLLTKKQMQGLAQVKSKGSNVQKTLRQEVDKIIERMLEDNLQA